MRLVALTCEVLARSTYLCAARSPNVVDVRLHRRGLHENPPNLRTTLQDEIQGVRQPYDAVVLAYGLCGGAMAGLYAGAVPLVIPRAHDCITLFLGDRERYREEFTSHPGTFWYVRDYLERTDEASAFTGVGAASDGALRATYEDYVERFGTDNADYLMEALGTWTSHYDRAAFIDMGAGDEGEAALRARQEAERRGWAYNRLEGQLGLVRRLVDGEWDDDFLVLQPGECVGMTYDDQIVRSESSLAAGRLPSHQETSGQP